MGVVCSGSLLFISGQGPVDPLTQEFRLGSFADQARLALRNLEAVVHEAGATLARAVKVKVYLRDMSNFDVMNSIYRDFFPQPWPARTTCQSDLDFEIEVDAVVALDIPAEEK